MTPDPEQLFQSAMAQVQLEKKIFTQNNICQK
jgi:hypothetical protein